MQTFTVLGICNKRSYPILEDSTLHDTSKSKSINVEELFLKTEDGSALLHNVPTIAPRHSFEGIFDNGIAVNEGEKVAVEFVLDPANKNILYILDNDNFNSSLDLLKNLIKLKKNIFVGYRAGADDLIKNEIERINDLSKKTGIPVLILNTENETGVKNLISIASESLKKDENQKQSKQMALIDGMKKINKSKKGYKVLEKILDPIIKNPIANAITFVLINYLMFWSIFNVGRGMCDALMDGSSFIFNYLGDSIPNVITILGKNISLDHLKIIIKNPINTGVSSIVQFIPRIFILNFFISTLKSSGYMSRALHSLSNYAAKVGISPESVFSVVNGLGCSVPAYISCGKIKDINKREESLILSSFMPCNAQMTICVFFIEIFFNNHKTLIMTGMYFLAISLGILAAKIMAPKYKMQASNSISVSAYKIPKFYYIAKHSINSSLKYAKDTIKIIIPATILIWALSSITISKKISNNIKSTTSHTKQYQSGNAREIFNQISGKKNDSDSISVMEYLIYNAQFAFRPVGLNYKLTTITIASMMSDREASIAFMGLLYSGDGNTMNNNMKESISIPSAISYILLVLLWIPCLMATVTAIKQFKSKRRAFKMIMIKQVTLYALISIIYNIASIIIP
ncbi:hypothetical protein N9A04_00230 [Rickettsiales bacterium]|nr:hypothetical protein [Rickettsiales bacterium]